VAASTKNIITTIAVAGFSRSLLTKRFTVQDFRYAEVSRPFFSRLRIPLIGAILLLFPPKNQRSSAVSGTNQGLFLYQTILTWSRIANASATESQSSNPPIVLESLPPPSFRVCGLVACMAPHTEEPGKHWHTRFFRSTHTASRASGYNYDKIGSMLRKVKGTPAEGKVVLDGWIWVTLKAAQTSDWPILQKAFRHYCYWLFDGGGG